MTPIELERITAPSYVGAPIGLDPQPLFVSALSDLQARENARRQSDYLRSLKTMQARSLFGLIGRPPARETAPRHVVWHSQGSGKSNTMARVIRAAVHIYDLVMVDGSHRSSSYAELWDDALGGPGDGRESLWHGLQEAALHNSSPAAAGGPEPRNLAAGTYSSRLARLHSGFELAAELAARRSWRPDTPAAPPAGTEDLPQPLAIACGITRLQAPLIPRAPGRPGAAGRFGVGVRGLTVSLAA
ncbi:hypothetical protein [Kitasatospora phosalacinea]|uniref:Uncharacterized protein n=1 Tax=Kitasatospora phosalacinea TaxID=2065 RepID=A0A9W6ULW5_9ACTN|nr:hypothetical protein [Kitasatospora phosalacinea]GLW53039.1 hypothetical protein Kpho01_10500 [Kitasatospora phosalacinea]